jgi:hypothetical protein
LERALSVAKSVGRQAPQFRPLPYRATPSDEIRWFVARSTGAASTLKQHFYLGR